MIRRILGGIGGYLAAAGAALLGVLAIWASGKRAGKGDVVAERAQKELEHAKTGQQVDQDVATRKPDDVQQRLRDKYSRD